MATPGDIFLHARDIRTNARAYLIIHNEVRSIENAILLAADNGLLDAIVYNTYMTNTTLPSPLTVDSVNDANDTIEVTSHGIDQGAEIKFETSDTLPEPLNATDSYYAIIVDANNIKVANSFVDSVNNQAINITTTGTGTHQIKVLSPQEQFFRTWKGLRIDRSQIDQMNGVIKHFRDLGYEISRKTNPNTDVTFEWHISW